MTDHLAQMDAQIVLPRPDRRPIYEWAKDNVVLPEAYALPGAFDVRSSPWLMEPFKSIRNPLVRRTTAIAAVQSGKTLFAELTVLYWLANDPGPCTYTFQSDEMAARAMKTRINPLLEACEKLARILPDKGPLRTTQEIYFGAFFFIANSANLSHQQSQSIRYKVNDELFMPQWADVYSDACARVTAFEQQGTSHILDISQAGIEGDWAEWSFTQGSQERWHARCANPSCGKAYELAFHQKRADGKRAGVVWDEAARRQDGSYDEVLARETARFECPHCGHVHEDCDATRAHWRKTGHYVSARENPPNYWRSFHWEALVAHPIKLLVAEYCQAENHFCRMGDEEPRKKFKQKREARSWQEKKTVIELAANDSGYTAETYADGKPLPNELLRTMSLDKQETHWWCEIGCWVRAQSGMLEYRQLYFSRIESREEALMIGGKYNVPREFVGQDRGYRPTEVDLDSLNFGWSGMEGSKTHGKRWMFRNEQQEVINLPHSETLHAAVDQGRVAAYMVFDGDFFKDILSNALAGKGGLRWLFPMNVNPLWREHIKGESKQEVRPGKWEWREVKQNAPNHGLDTSVMQLVIAMVAGIVKFIDDPAKPA